MIGDNQRKLFNSSYQRAVSPDTYGFYKRFFQKLYAADAQIAGLFAQNDVNRCIKMLIQSMSQMLTYSATSKPTRDMEKIADIHGAGRLNLPPSYYDIWLECMIQTLQESDPEFDGDVETSWRKMMTPGISYLKAFCTR